MLQEIKDLQNRAVSELVRKSGGSKHKLTFRAPTGSGKTHMMADFMNSILQNEQDIVFLVSSLSKGDLARQNHLSFCRNRNNGTFPSLNPYLISTEISGEETLHIPTDYNVYVLPRDLFKKNGRLMAGPMTAFLQQLTEGSLFGGLNKRIWLIKDECHQATNKLDELSGKFFSKTINFSATPKLSRGQLPDVEITDEQAVSANLIKRIEFGADTDTVEDAVCKFEEVKKQYISLGVNPCLIIQISNKDRAEEEWLGNIKPVLQSTAHQSLKWMLIVDKDKDCDTNDDVRKLKVGKWKDYAKLPASTIDVIVFKMVISEGWDIPRACMLYQVRDTQSKQLDEQVMGRVRRNPRLLDFETLTNGQKDLAMTAWIWGIKPKERTKTMQVRLWNEGGGITKDMAIKTTYLQPLAKRKDFDVERFFEQKKDAVANESVFALYQRLASADNGLQDLCYQYAGGDVRRWAKFMMNFGAVRHRYNQYFCNYDESMQVSEKNTSFPVKSYYLDTNNRNAIDGWIWCKKGDTPFAFDSDAESQWASVLQRVAKLYGARLEANELFSGEARYLWGKNFPPNSDIRYEYYADGIHSSYPDFVMKDHKGNIHLFEVKSVNKSGGTNIDPEQYEDKVRQLKDCYRACSKKLSGYIFYLPVLKDDVWQITRFCGGDESTISRAEFEESLK